ncbi:hypothetical protein BM525_19240 (plasmid) [Alteromonas mediterranea]|uniref:DUF2797 domain-containing protein n=2 Tax=Alteromonas mediterranea TaxID=314275 RepID=A0AAC9JEA6_9ALTE|nr:hypothetical protein BM524_19045 [Alteromonas mediterranea]APE00350.1 hypothetical protein BM525_19240 [Alteromonas mediterranea]
MQNTVTGTIKKMVAHAECNDTAVYSLPIADKLIPMNALIGKQVTLTCIGTLNCVHCDASTHTLHKQGYCKTCADTLQEVADCNLKPERCRHETGSCANPHFIYLSHTGSAKVGITRNVDTVVSSRWIDQGATTAVPIIKTKNRNIAGIIEVFMKDYISDRTNWRKMLADVPFSPDIEEERISLKGVVQRYIDKLNARFGSEVAQWLEDADIVGIKYPVNAYPEKVKAIAFNIGQEMTLTLEGIKGQYLIFSDVVMNVRKFAGYNFTLSYEE